MSRFRSVELLQDREVAALAGTAFARSQAYSTILIALALYADLFQTTGFVEGLFGTAFALVQLVIREQRGNPPLLRWEEAGLSASPSVAEGRGDCPVVV